MSFRLAGLVLALIVALAVLISAAQALQGSAPTIKITSPKNGAKVTKAEVQVVGNVSKPHDSVTVNGQEVNGIGPTSSIFQKAVSLKTGSNTITATVTSGGLSASDTITVIRGQSTHKRRIQWRPACSRRTTCRSPGTAASIWTTTSASAFRM